MPRRESTSNLYVPNKGAGDLNRKLVLQAKWKAPDGGGGFKDDFADILKDDGTTLSVWADIEPLTANELLRAQQLSSDITTRVIIRFRTDIDASMRFRFTSPKYGTKYYHIHGVINPQDERKWLVCMCEERAK